MILNKTLSDKMQMYKQPDSKIYTLKLKLKVHHLLLQNLTFNLRRYRRKSEIMQKWNLFLSSRDSFLYTDLLGYKADKKIKAQLFIFSNQKLAVSGKSKLFSSRRDSVNYQIFLSLNYCFCTPPAAHSNGKLENSRQQCFPETVD